MLGSVKSETPSAQAEGVSPLKNKVFYLSRHEIVPTSLQGAPPQE